MYQNLMLLFAAVALMLTAIFTARLLIARQQAQRAQSYRGLFLYSDGKRIRSIDPITAVLAFEAHPTFRFDRHPELAAAGDKEAIATVADAVRSVFGVPEYTVPGKPGLTVAECYRLLQTFALYAEEQKKNISPSATFAPSMGPTSPNSSDGIVSDMLPSGSIVDAPV